MGKKSKGFSLIELLVVIAIIGLLATIVTASLAGYRVKSRDSRRVADMKQMQIALELYYAEYSEYPKVNPTDMEGTDQASSFTVNARELVDKGYLPSVPTDPLNPSNKESDNSTYVYRYAPLKNSNQATKCKYYHLGAVLEGVSGGDGPLGSDKDFTVGNYSRCIDGVNAFEGSSKNCKTSLGPGDVDKCYDLTP